MLTVAIIAVLVTMVLVLGGFLSEFRVPFWVIVSCATAITLGIMCNALVCLAVWMCFSARSTTDKILAIIFPITAFVALGFEHCIAYLWYVREIGDGEPVFAPQQKLA